MPKAAAGSTKAVANAMKAKGLGRLRWYCQVCQKQCRDENGFKCHTASEGHLRAMLVVGENAGKHISDYSSQFQHDFVQLLSRRWGTKRVRANQCYQELISDKNHMHMNATRWLTLTEFVKHLGRSGIAKVDENEKGWWLTWIDNSPKALTKADATQKRERQDMDDEQRERKHIEEQIARAAEQAAAQEPIVPEASTSAVPAAELPTAPAGPIKIGLSLKKPSPPVPDEPKVEAAAGAIALPKPNPLKLNPLKAPSSNPLKANPLKMGGSTSVPPKPSISSQPLSSVEQIMKDDLERKKRMAERQNSGFADRDAKRPRVEPVA